MVVLVNLQPQYIGVQPAIKNFGEGIDKVIELYFLNPLWQTQSEVKETVFAILFVSVSIWFGMELQKNRGDDLNQTSHNPA